MKRILAAMVLLTASMVFAAEMPKTVIHVITIKWIEGATPEQKAKAISGAEAAAKLYPGIKRMWIRALKVQGVGYESAIVMEFESEDALKKYTDSPAQQWWYKLYLPIRDESRTHDVTN